jgi:type I restriction enzyme R subunit
VGVIEAKHVGDTLSGVAEQTAKYVGGIPNNLPHIHEPLPFAYESTGIETIFRDNRDPETCSKPIFAFHKPEHLLYLGNQEYTLLTLLCILYVSHTADFGNWQMSSSTMIEYTKN